MHRKPESELVPLDAELERTLKNLKKVRFAETVVMVEQREIQQQIPGEEVDRPQGKRTMEEFWKLVIRDDYSAVRQPTIEANNFELKPTLITMVQQNQFTVILMKTPMNTWAGFLE